MSKNTSRKFSSPVSILKVSIFQVFLFLAFLYSDINIFLQKHKNWKTYTFINFVVSPKVFKLQRRTIPHFKALDQLFWPLAWLLTLGVITFVIWNKMFCKLFFSSPSMSLSKIFIAPYPYEINIWKEFINPRFQVSGISSSEAIKNLLKLA